MRRTNYDFEKRKKELEKYFDFLKALNFDKPALHYEELGIVKIIKVKGDLVRILKANGFLLIYNLIESTCRNSLIDILSAIQSKRLDLKKVSAEIQFLWIKQRTQNLRDPKTKKETIDKQFHIIAQEVIDKTLIDFSTSITKLEDPDNPDLELFGLSGNINASKIKQMAEFYGFETTVSSTRLREGASLEDVKTKRNYLAHGRITFAECGSSYTVQQMCTFKDNTINFLEGVVTDIDNYIKTNKFKLSRSTTTTP